MKACVVAVMEDTAGSRRWWYRVQQHEHFTRKELTTAALFTVITAKTCADKRIIRVFLLLSIQHQFSVYKCDLRKS